MTLLGFLFILQTVHILYLSYFHLQNIIDHSRFCVAHNSELSKFPKPVHNEAPMIFNIRYNPIKFGRKLGSKVVGQHS